MSEPQERLAESEHVRRQLAEALRAVYAEGAERPAVYAALAASDALDQETPPE